jgi:hypothetical protein
MCLILEIKRFKKYCNDFYNIKYGVYPIATTREISKAVDKYICKPKHWSLEFDSMDREQVREILGK